MNKSAVPIQKAAKEMGITPRAIRKWIDRGAPTVSLGKPGRGNGYLVNVEDLKRWRYGNVDLSTERDLEKLCDTLRDVMLRDAVYANRPLDRAFNLKQSSVALVLIEVFQRYALKLHGAIPDPPPDYIVTLIGIVKEEMERKVPFLTR